MRCCRVCVVLLCVIEFAAAQVRDIRIDTLTLDRVVALAHEHHPLLRSAEASIRSAEAGLTQATASYLPSIMSSATASRTEGAFVFNPDFPPRDQKYNNYSASIQANQTIFDFGKTISRVSASGKLVDAAEADYQSTRSAVVMNAQLSYFGYIQAKQIVGVDEEAVANAEAHVKQAKAFFSVGKRAQVDVTKTEVDLANANVNLIRARNQLRVAKLQLDNAMGVHPVGEYVLVDSLAVQPFAMVLDSVRAIAMQQRPELLSARARVDANQSLVTAAWTQHLPTLSAFGTYTWSNFDFPLFSRWNAGVTFTLPIFQGFATQAGVDQARANADIAQANLDVLTQNAVLDIEQNYFGLKEAEERIGASSKLVEQAEENLNIAERQYAAGVASALEVTDAQVSLSNARITKIQALYDYNSSLVRLQRAMGVLR
ncbi:MAG: TolC family protein [Ignavibacteriae bacterium]|nr:TolC family protein [Ignavibacteria bacterium]MBI3365169.1 TolC family protein [Ignavibacteriota bacterium]